MADERSSAVATHPFGMEVGDGIVRLAGDVDRAAAVQMLEVIDCVTECVNVDSLVVDLAAVTFIDSAGLDGLARCRRLVEEHGAALILTNVPLTVQKRMQMAGATRLFGLAV